MNLAYVRDACARLVLGVGMAVLASLATAQLAPPRTLEELKDEVQARVDRRAYPVAAEARSWE